MAVLRCFENVRDTAGERPLRPLRLVSFECDLDPLRLASRHAGYFPHARHAAPKAILAEGLWTDASGAMRWELKHGDFLEYIEGAPAPDIIFYDPFSAKTGTPH